MKVMERSGCREPFLQGGVSNYLGWRNLGLSFNLAYSFGSKIRLFSMYPSDGSIVGPERNLRKELTKRWQRSGDESHTNIPGILPWRRFPLNRRRLSLKRSLGSARC